MTSPLSSRTIHGSSTTTTTTNTLIIVGVAAAAYLADGKAVRDALDLESRAKLKRLVLLRSLNRILAIFEDRAAALRARLNINMDILADKQDGGNGIYPSVYFAEVE